MDKVTYRTTKSELLKVSLPEQTKSYKPITHQQLIDLTHNSILGAGYEIENEWYESAREGQIATGHYSIRNIADSEMQLRIAWQNSYNKQVSLKFALGVHVFVCSNGACSGDMGAFRRKHTGDVQEFTPVTIEEYIRTAGMVFEQMQKQRDAMKEIQLSKRVQAELLGRMYIEEDFIESTQMNIIKRELAKASYNYGAPNSMWEMYQFTTFAMRDIHPSLWMKNHLAANSFFVKEAGLYVPKSEPIVVSMGDVVPPNQVDMFEVPGFVESEDNSRLDVEQYPVAPNEAYIAGADSFALEHGPVDLVQEGDSMLDAGYPDTGYPAESVDDIPESLPLEEDSIGGDKYNNSQDITTNQQTTEYSDLI